MVEEEGLGLVSEPPGSEPLAPPEELGGLQLASEPPAVAAPTATSVPARKEINPSPLLLALDVFGSSLAGRPSTLMQLKKDQADQRRQNLQDITTRLEITREVTKQAQSLPEEERTKYLDAIQGQYDDPELKRMLKFAGKSPDVLQGYDAAVKADPLIRSLAANGKLTGFMETEVGQKYIRERLFPSYAKEWGTKSPELINWTRENRSEVYQKALKDGKLTTTELRDILDSAPENLKPTPQSTAYFFTPEGQKRLAGVIGIPVVTDETAEKMMQKDMESSDTTLLKHLKELEEAEAGLSGASGADKEKQQRRVTALQKKILAETTDKPADALKEMRNNIILKTAKMKESNPNYQMPAHEKFLIDEYNKSDALERLRSEILQGRNDTIAGSGKGPTLAEFLPEAKRANQGMTDEQLKEQWQKKYGGK